MTGSLWTGPRGDHRRYQVDLEQGELVSHGGGGEGLVYKAVTDLDGAPTEVALKLLTSLSLEDYERLAWRARMMAYVDSPHVMRQLDTFIGTALLDQPEVDNIDFDVIYSVARWVPGVPLEQALAVQGPTAGLRWVVQIARGVAALHSIRAEGAAEGLVHRDIKPSNIRITDEGSAVLIDFGIAKPHDHLDHTSGAGTYLWRAPEVIGGPGSPGPASDAWGVGAVAYWVIVGEPPRLEGAAAARERIIPAAKQSGLADPVGLGHHISSLLNTNPADRPADLVRWSDELGAIVSGARRRRRSLKLAAIMACVLLIAAAGVLAIARPGNVDRSTSAAFRPEYFQNGLIVYRTWTLGGSSGDLLQGEVVLLNSGRSALQTAYNEVIPSEVTTSAHSIGLNPPPENIVKADPVLRYRIDLSSGESTHLHYRIAIHRTSGSWSTRLNGLVNDQNVEQDSFYRSADLLAPIALTSLRITVFEDTAKLSISALPQLTPAEEQKLSLVGVMSNGTPAPAGVLSRAMWSSSAPSVVAVTQGSLFAVKAGSAKIVAQDGAIRAEFKVTVVNSDRSAIGLNGKASSPSTPAKKSTSSPSTTTTVVSPPKPGQPSSSSTTQPISITPTTLPPAASPITPATPTPPVTTSGPGATYSETTGGVANTWTDYETAGGSSGPGISSNQTVQIECKVSGFRVADGNTWWYRIASSPWNGAYYVSADAFYNNGETSGSLVGTPFVDPAVPNC